MSQYDRFGNKKSVLGFKGEEKLLNRGEFDYDSYMSSYLKMRRPEAPKWDIFCRSKAVYELEELSIFPETGNYEVLGNI
jgi:hypothetical protein